MKLIYLSIDFIVCKTAGIEINKILVIGLSYMRQNDVENTAPCGKHDT